MTNQHPFTPPSELIKKWVRMLEYLPGKQVFSEVAQWGADQALKACIEELVQSEGNDAREFLRAARRPKPPSLKEQAIDALHGIHDQGPTPEQVVIIRRALETLND